MKEMSGNDDLSQILNRWEFNEEKDIRRVRTPSGREVIQRRLPLGIEQYEINGRPDGLKPDGFESWLDNYMHQAQVFGREFILDDEACERLQNEGLLYYHRYLIFFQVQDYERCMRDTSRNLRLLDFVNRYGGKPEHAELLEQYRPYILRMQIMAKALLRLKERGDLRGAIRILKGGLAEISRLPEIPNNDIFDFERSRSLKSLEDLLSQLESQVPPSPRQQRDQLRRQLDEAVGKEDYERAALIRDQIQRIERRKRPSQQEKQ
jgi:hypothetical protein